MTEKHEANVWLINTGWTGGIYGTGKRMSLKHTRAILDSIHDGTLEKAEYETLPVFNLRVPKSCSNVPKEILNPKNTWSDKAGFDETIKKLAAKFVTNFKQFEDKVPQNVTKHGGPQH